VAVIGDALAPATIAHATYAGRRYAEECDAAAPTSVAHDADAVPFRREITELAGLPKPPLSEHPESPSS
jgi:dimethylamine/trimethylamine dehydrogenase